MKKKQIEWINILRGLAIILIVLGHAIGYSNKLNILTVYLSSFYVPLFFFISGYLLKEEKEENFIYFCKRKAKKILIPYFVFATLSLIPYYLFASNIQSNLSSTKDISSNILESFINILYGSGHGENLSQNTPLWFLPCFFVVTILGKIIVDLFKKYKHKHKYLFLSIFFFIIGYIVSTYFNYPLPYNIETALVMLYFYYLGTYIKTLEAPSSKKLLILGIILSIVSFSLTLGSSKISCRYNDYQGHYLLFIISASLTCIGYTFMFSFIKKCNPLSYIGKHTIPILVFHKMPLVVFQTYFGPVSYYLKNGNTITQLLCSILITILSIICSLIAFYIINKFLPIVYGNDRVKKVVYSEVSHENRKK